MDDPIGTYNSPQPSMTHRLKRFSKRYSVQTAICVFTVGTVFNCCAARDSSISAEAEKNAAQAEATSAALEQAAAFTLECSHGPNPDAAREIFIDDNFVLRSHRNSWARNPHMKIYGDYQQFMHCSLSNLSRLPAIAITFYVGGFFDSGSPNISARDDFFPYTAYMPGLGTQTSSSVEIVNISRKIVDVVQCTQLEFYAPPGGARQSYDLGNFHFTQHVLLPPVHYRIGQAYHEQTLHQNLRQQYINQNTNECTKSSMPSAIDQPGL